jgi:hypothetical protein
LPMKGARDAAADGAGRSRDQGGFSGEIEHRVLFKRSRWP